MRESCLELGRPTFPTWLYILTVCFFVLYWMDVYVYVHVPKCRYHGTGVFAFYLVWDAPYCWVLHTYMWLQCYIQADWLTSFWEFSCLCFPSSCQLCHYGQLPCGFPVFKLRSSCGFAGVFLTESSPQPSVYLSFREQIGLMSIFYWKNRNDFVL